MEHHSRQLSNSGRYRTDRLSVLLLQESSCRPKRTIRSGLAEPGWEHQADQGTLAEDEGERGVTRKIKERFSKSNTEWSPIS